MKLMLLCVVCNISRKKQLLENLF